MVNSNCIWYLYQTIKKCILLKKDVFYFQFLCICFFYSSKLPPLARITASQTLTSLAVVSFDMYCPEIISKHFGDIPTYSEHLLVVFPGILILTFPHNSMWISWCIQSFVGYYKLILLVTQYGNLEWQKLIKDKQSKLFVVIFIGRNRSLNLHRWTQLLVDNIIDLFPW